MRCEDAIFGRLATPYAALRAAERTERDGSFYVKAALETQRFSPYNMFVPTSEGK